MTTERNLLNLALNTIGQLGLSTDHVRSGNPAAFAGRVSGVFEILNAMAPAKLGEIIALALGPGDRTGFRSTSVASIDRFGTGAWTGQDAKRHLVLTARPVLLAAIYDILVARMVLAAQRAGVQPSVDVAIPTKAMMRFADKRPSSKLVAAA